MLPTLSLESSPVFGRTYSNIVHGNPTSSVIVSLLVLDVVDYGFELLSGQHTDYDIGICYFSVNQALLRCKSTYWLAQNQDSVP